MSASATTVDLVDIIRLLQDALTEALCETVWKRLRFRERKREWTLYTLGKFWIGVVLRAPGSLTLAMEQASKQLDAAWPEMASSAQGLFYRCQTLHHRFFAGLFHAFVARLLPRAEVVFAASLSHLRKHFTEVWILDGSRLDPIQKRLKALHDIRAVILPGSILAAYDLFRGVLRHLHFDPDAARAEIERARDVLGHIPRGTLLVADRLYAVPAFVSDLAARGLFLVTRRKRGIKFRTLRVFRDAVGNGYRIQDRLVRAGTGPDACQLRWLRLSHGRRVLQIVTNVLDPEKLDALDAFVLYKNRWSIERAFFDLKEVLQLNAFHGANANSVAMQLYATAMVYVALRIAQGWIAQQSGHQPEDFSPAKLFPRIAAAAEFAAGWESATLVVQQRNPHVALQIPDLHGNPGVTITIENILVEKRSEHRRKRRYCESRRRWKPLPPNLRGGS